MRSIVLLAAAITALAMPTTGNAAAIDHYECDVMRIVPPERNDHDPVVRTTITTMAVGHRVTGFTVEHETMTGAVYVRQEQYRDQRVWTTGNGHHWSGRSIRNPRLTMIGTLSHNPRGLFYIERISSEGRLETTIIQQCRNNLDAHAARLRGFR